MIKPAKLGFCNDSLCEKINLISALLEGENAEEALIVLGYLAAHQMSMLDYSVASKLYVFLTSVMSMSIETSAQEKGTARYKFEPPEDDE